MRDAGSSLGVQASLLNSTGVEFALQPAHASHHGIDVTKDILLGWTTRNSGGGRVFE
jgi:hypothetical protein